MAWRITNTIVVLYNGYKGVRHMDKKANVLVCEDEEDIRKLIKVRIENQGYSVLEAKNGLEGLNIIKNSEVHLLLLDVMMPFKNGFEVIKELRSVHNDVPIIVLTARTEEDNRILGLDLGADDYICKPFNYRELISRVNAQLRRYLDFASSRKVVYKNGDLSLYPEEFTVLRGEEPVELNPQEFKLLEIFISNPGRVYTKEQLYEMAWGDTYVRDDNTLMVHISRLRDKLHGNNDEQNYIQTIRGLGYRMVKIDEN